MLTPDLGPFLCGWIDSQPAPTVRLDAPIRENIKHTLLVADIDIERKVKAPDLLQPLGVSISGTGSWEDDLGLIQTRSRSGAVAARISCPRPDTSGGYGDLLIDLYWLRSGSQVCTFAPVGDRENIGHPLPVALDWPDTHKVSETTENISGRNLVKTTYRADDWRSYCDSTGELNGLILAQDAQGTIRRGPLHVNLYARVVEKVQSHKNGDLSRWQ